MRSSFNLRIHEIIYLHWDSAMQWSQVEVKFDRGQVWPKSSLSAVKFDRSQVWPQSSFVEVKLSRFHTYVCVPIFTHLKEFKSWQDRHLAPILSCSTSEQFVTLIYISTPAEMAWCDCRGLVPHQPNSQYHGQYSMCVGLAATNQPTPKVYCFINWNQAVST